jgi:tyrosyl-tRNA synthetase
LQRHYDQPSQIILMTPIIEGLDGVQKMSKSLNNAIGIHEPPQEMYGKLMSINDELMWRYWTLLTDLRQSEIDTMQADVASGALHPMEAKKRLARTIVAGFHSEEAAKEADENWARLFQQKDTSAVTEEQIVDLKLIAAADAASLERAVSDPSIEVRVNVAKLLVALGIKASRTEAEKQVAAGVNIDGATTTQKFLDLPRRPARLTIRVGKKAKIAVIE